MLAVAAAALRVLAAAAQQDFRSGVNLVLVDMRVLQGDDQVTDLRVEEVTLIVDGIPRPIVSFWYRVLEPGKHGGRARVDRSKGRRRHSEWWDTDPWTAPNRAGCR